MPIIRSNGGGILRVFCSYWSGSSLGSREPRSPMYYISVYAVVSTYQFFEGPQSHLIPSALRSLVLVRFYVTASARLFLIPRWIGLVLGIICWYILCSYRGGILDVHYTNHKLDTGSIHASTVLYKSMLYLYISRVLHDDRDYLVQGF